MISRYALLSSRIRQDLADLESVVQRARRYVAVASTSSDPEPYLDAAALHLHGFYAGLERLFETIARQLDHLVPSGPRWHQELLAQMALEVDGVRPAVLTREAVAALQDYLGFRHVVHNVYTTKLKPERVRELSQQLGKTFEQVRQELLAFADLLEQLAAGEKSAGDTSPGTE